MIGLVKGSEITTNRDGENNVRMLKAEITDPEDIQTIQQVRESGDDTNPENDAKILIIKLSESYKLAILIDDGVEPSVDLGEKKIYSTDGGAVQAFIHLKNDGNIEVNGSGDYAVRYNELETAFNQLKSDFDSLVSTFNTHTHPYVDTPVGASTTSPTLTPGSPTTADVSGAKVDTVELPS